MRTLKHGILIILMLITPLALIYSQEEGNSQSFWVHEDVVKPSMVGLELMAIHKGRNG